jgi:two-component system sensor histidine kinase KdpD
MIKSRFEKPTLPTILHYVFPILIVAFTTAILWLVQGTFTIQVIALLYLLPVVFSTRAWGLGPGVMASLASFLCFNYFFIQPLYTLAVHQYQDLMAMIVFLIIAIVISQLLGHDQESLSATKAREREATHLYELSTALAGLLDDQAIAQTIARKTCETFFAERVEVMLRNYPEGSFFQCGQDSPQRQAADRQDFSAPLATTRGQLGTVHIWRKSKPLSETEKRLLNTFTSQGALAIERAILLKTENRAQVLEESDQLKSALLSSVSHELRSPLATIKASISSLRSGAVDWDSESRVELLTAIEEETDHLNQLVGNLLDMSRIETGALNPQRKWNSIIEIIHGVLKRMHQDIQNHTVKIDASEDLPLIPVDYVQIAQVFTNLISNSVKYAPAGSEIIIRLSLKDDQFMHIQVSNEGPQVAEEHLNRIFDKFYRVTSADRVTGTGLGLSICKGIIEAHGGRIWAENVPGHFLFNFILPLSWDGIHLQLPKDD